MSAPSPYLRDRLLQAADGLRKDAEGARLNVAAADQDVAAARALLAEAEAHAARARAEVDGIEAGIAWAQAHAATITREIDADPAAKLRATGLMRHEPKPVDPGPVSATLYQDNGLPMVWSDLDPPGGYVCAVYETAGGPGIDMPNGTRICGRPVESEPCDQHGAPDDLTAPGVADSRAQIAPHLPPPVPHEPLRIDTVHTSGTGAGQLVATSGPTVTMPDTGLNPPPLPPADPSAEPRHAKPADRPGLLARLTGGHRTIPGDQDGDADE